MVSTNTNSKQKKTNEPNLWKLKDVISVLCVQMCIVRDYAAATVVDE